MAVRCFGGLAPSKAAVLSYFSTDWRSDPHEYPGPGQAARVTPEERGGSPKGARTAVARALDVEANTLRLSRTAPVRGAPSEFATRAGLF